MKAIQVALRFLTAYALVKHKDGFINRLQQYVLFDPEEFTVEAKYIDLLKRSVKLGDWGEHYHYLALSFILNIPIFQFHTFQNVHTGCFHIDPLLTPLELVEYFHEHRSHSGAHLVFCSSEQFQVVQSGDLSVLHRPPICVFLNRNHYTAMVYLRPDVHSLIPVPYARLVLD